MKIPFRSSVAEDAWAQMPPQRTAIPGLRSHNGYYDLPTSYGVARTELLNATSVAGRAALYGAFRVKHRGNQSDIAYAETIAAIARHMAMAAYAIVNDQPILAQFDILVCDTVMQNAEIASAAVSACRAKPSLARMVQQLPWYRTSMEKVPSADLDHVASHIAEATMECAAATQKIVANARATNEITTMPAKGLQAPFNAKDLPRLHRVCKLARMAAASASAVASAICATHPDEAARTAHAASLAVAASIDATITQLTMQLALLPMLDLDDKAATEITEMRKVLEMVESDMAPPNVKGRNRFHDIFAMPEPRFTIRVSKCVTSMLENGTLKVTAADGSDCASISSEMIPIIPRSKINHK